MGDPVQNHPLDRMFVAAMVARPAICAERGLRWIGRRRASHRGQTVGQDSEVIADAGREGEVRFFGDINSTPEAVGRLVVKLNKRRRQLVIDGIGGGAMGRAAAVDGPGYAAMATPVTSAQAVNN
jgi:hypothetical protein